MEIKITENEYRNKVLGGWLGKNIGGTLGMPFEGTKDMLELSFYDPIPTEAVGNDDLDLQLVWVHTLLEQGIKVNEHDMREAWLAHVKDPYPDEYAKCYINMQKGLLAPACGWYNNPFANCMGAPIRSEIWAMICPGYPSQAAVYAYNDAIVDHSNEGLYGEIFLTTLESAAFCEKNIDKLLDIGSSFIPDKSEVAKAVRIVREGHQQRQDWKKVRKTLTEAFDTKFAWHTPPNIGFMVIGLLYGDDFESRLCTAVNCGYDTDCVGATIGAIMGIIDGADAIPQKWIDPIGTKIKHELQLVDFHIHDDINKLTEDTMKIGYKVLGNIVASDYFIRLDHRDIVFNKDEFKRPEMFKLHQRGIDVISVPFDGGIAQVQYNGQPTIGFGEPKVLDIKVELENGAKLKDVPDVIVPKNWQSNILATSTNSKYEYKIELVVPNSEECLIESSNTIGIDFGINKQEHKNIDISILGKAVWLATAPIAIADDCDFKKIFEEEKALCLDSTNPDVNILQLDDESICDLFGGQSNCLIYAQTSIYFPKERELLVALDCNDAVALWFEGEMVLSAHKHDEVQPSAHRSKTTKGKITVKKGWNRFFMKLLNNRDDYEGYFFLATPHPGYMGIPNIRFDTLERSR